MKNGGNCPTFFWILPTLFHGYECPFFYPLAQLIDLIVGQCDTSVCPIHGSVDGQTTAAQAMNADLPAQAGVLRRYLPVGMSPGDSLISIEVDLALL